MLVGHATSFCGIYLVDHCRLPVAVFALYPDLGGLIVVRWQMEHSALAKLLNRDDVRGRIIRDAAVIDLEMGVAICIYFTTNQRFDSFHELMVDKLGFNQKLEILEKIPYQKRYLSLKSLSHIRHLQQIRNYLAHRHCVHQDDRKFVSAAWKQLFSDYPKSYDAAVHAARRSIGRLINTNEFMDHFKRP